ncbi:hypothetical protein DNTS_017210 [Danionella cerebrum]|uniref:NADH dehydrogenase [ubiquinone] 1 beta subcomplex subunit 7 n=1 Tax=Danionella cerebrum TaxID=2873325 RepID=A0A553QBN4_9TELE|nr:hypothetical protein DNTS_017210 [Danionella translucida]
MGSHLVRAYITETDTEPKANFTPSYDPQLGFEDRKERVMVASQEQMRNAMLPLKQRDYCAHHLLMFMKCRRDYFPNIFACKDERHDWDLCEHKDYVMRLKEYERERRLNKRKKRIEEKAD